MHNNAHQMLSDLFSKKAASKESVAQVAAGFTPALLNVLSDAQKELALAQSKGARQEFGYNNKELRQIVSRIAQQNGYQFSDYEIDQVVARLELASEALGILQSLVDDRSISDIIVRSYNQIEYQRGRRNFRSDLSFTSQADYESFVGRLLARCQKSCSVKVPIVDVMLDSLTRLNVVHQCLAQNGPYLTIRLNRFHDINIEQLIESELAPKEVFEYLRAAVKSGLTVLIAGEVGTGKTTLSRALAAEVAVDESILVIEDTPEIRLQHPFVRYVVSRTENSEGVGKVGPSECIRAGMRMAMSRIIFGEMRDSEAAEAFIDVCASGHPGLSTIHARSAEDALTRLELFLGRAQRGVAAEVFQQQIATAVQVIVHVNFCRLTGMRRIMQVKEIGRVTDGKLKQTPIFSYFNGGQPRWRLDHRLSNFRDKLQESNPNFSLVNIADYLDLGPTRLGMNKSQTEMLSAWS